MSFIDKLITGFGSTSAFMKNYGKDQAIYQDEINKVNYKWMRKARQTEWTDTVNSMRSANINPALAYGSGPVTSDMTPTQATAEHPLQMALGLGSQIGALGKTKAEIKNINENTELQRQQGNTEQTIQALNLSKKMLNDSERVLNDKNAHYLDRNMALQFKKMASEIALNYGQGAMIRSNISLNNTLQDLKKAETRFTNERSRGYHRSISLPFGMGTITSTGNSLNPWGKGKGEWREYPNKYDNGTHSEYVHY